MLELYNLSPARIAAQTPLWPRATLSRLLSEHAHRAPDAVALEDGARQLTFADAYRAVRSVAGWLARRGIRPGDVVAYQLPASFDAIILHHAIAMAGAVASPIALIHREHDLRHILGLAQPSLVVASPKHRGVSHAQMLRDAAAAIGLPTEVVPLAVGDLLTGPGREPGPDVAGRHDDPNAPLYVVWTSGTTGEPKGVIHTHNTGLCGISEKLTHMGVGAGDAMFIITPIAHAIGVYAINMLALGVRLVLLESWNADRAVEMIERLRPTFSFGPSTFLVDMLRCDALGSHDVSSLRVFSCGGAPIPPSTIELALERLPACRVLSSYGTSEEGSVTSVGPSDPPSLSAVSDGGPLPNIELRILGEGGRPLDPGQEGDLVVRGPSAFAGYVRRPDLTREAFVDGDWRWTGDRAIMRPDGAIRITGRTKDIIVRGGLNVPVAQVENALLRHPSIASIAVVAMPDERLGERACAYVVPLRNQPLTLDDLRATLLDQGIAKSFWPERLEVVEALPMTASGKVQKFVLREMIANTLRAERSPTSP